MNKVGVIVEGGVGKHVAFSAVLPKMKEKYGDVIVVSAYPEVFVDNVYVYRNLGMQHPYLFEDYLKDIRVIKSEPYLGDEYRFGKKHLIEAFADIVEVDYDKSMLPHFSILDEEEQHWAGYRKEVLKDSDYIVMQIRGGTSYLNPQAAVNKPVQTRDYPVELAQNFVDMFKKEYPKIHVIQVGLPTEPRLLGTIYLTGIPSRNYFVVMKHCKTFVVIDSFLGHISAGVQKRGVVLWGGTNPLNLGYEHNINISKEGSCETLHCNRPNLLFDNVGGTIWKCPRKYACMQIAPEIIMEQLKGLLVGETVDGKELCKDMGVCEGAEGLPG